MRVVVNCLFKAAKSFTFPELSGCVFAPLGTKGSVVTSNPQDTQLDRYLEVIRNDVIPTCQEIAPYGSKVHKRIGEMLRYNIGSVDYCWSFGVELVYRNLVPRKHLTESNLHGMRIIRASVEMLSTMLTIIDDVVDESPFRMNKPTWHRICEGERLGATYDSFICFQIPFYLARKFLAHKSCYPALLEIFAKAGMNCILGQQMDLLSRNSQKPEDYNTLAEMKVGNLGATCVALGTILAGVSDSVQISKMEKIFSLLGTAVQIWDDFCEVHCTEDLTRKRAVDSERGSKSWASSTALITLNGKELQLFKECYGSSDPQMREKVQQLYRDIGLPVLYMKQMYNIANDSILLIQQLSDEQMRGVCNSFLEWLIGDSRELKIVENYINHFDRKSF